MARPRKPNKNIVAPLLVPPDYRAEIQEAARNEGMAESELWRLLVIAGHPQLSRLLARRRKQMAAA